MARKRKRADNASCLPRKVPKPCAAETFTSTPAPLLALYYPKVLPLKDFFLARLPTTSRIRRRRIETLASENDASPLNTTLVGILSEPTSAIQLSRAAELAAFTQSQRNSALTNTAKGQTCSIDDIVDFVVWTLFRGSSVSYRKPRHLLCNGLLRTAAPSDRYAANDQVLRLPGIVQQHPNGSLKTLRCAPWTELLGLLGAEGESIFSNLLLDCAVFTQLSSGKKNYFQLSGIPVPDIELLRTAQSEAKVECNRSVLRRPTEIKLMRNRILYAKSSLNGHGQVHFGLKHVHVLQRYHQHHSEIETVHMMKHVFPRQFGLHNVFTSHVNAKETTHSLPDYTYREDEIKRDRKHPAYWIPKRLRGGPVELIGRVRKSHARCSYSQLLRHYCPISPSGGSFVSAKCKSLQDSQPSSAPLVTQVNALSSSYEPCSAEKSQQLGSASYLSYASPAASVSAFCKSVTLRLLPVHALGNGTSGHENWRLLLRSVDKFIYGRRFETLSLQEVIQGVKIKSIPWLTSPSAQKHRHLSKSELTKRTEIFHEFVYYIFDSLLIPLIRTNFYVTESGPLRNKLLYFRHDVWRKLTAPSLVILRLDLYQPIKHYEVRSTLNGRPLGPSHVRLLPKAEGTRTITNLKRRMLKSVNGRRVLCPSINSQLAPVFSALNYERSANPDLLRSAIFSISEAHKKLKDFKAGLPHDSKLYFIKIDVQSCFDTIPQARLLELVDEIIGSDCYKTTKYAEVKLAEKGVQRRQKFVNIARPSNAATAFSEDVAEDLVRTKQGAVLAEIGNARDWQRGELLTMLKDHINNNVVKIGKKHLRQKNGIPQGSILSSILCSYFYAAFESEHLQFLRSDSSLLLRLIDDFLLVTTDKPSARQFAETMMNSHPAYGIGTNAEKSLANFDIHVGATSVPQHHGRFGFPYCGIRIDVNSLEISKDRSTNNAAISNGLTVDTTRSAGSTFQRKMLLATKIQMQAMLIDSCLNSRDRVIATLMEVFSETAMKMHQYLKSMPTGLRPSTRIIILVITALVEFVSRYATGKCSTSVQKGDSNQITRKQVCWMASACIEQVFLQKQSRYREVLVWLESLRMRSEASMSMSRQTLRRMLDDCKNVFTNYVY